MLAGLSKLRRPSRVLMALFYLAAGVNHFWHPEFYLPLIPPYFPWPEAINILSGIAEIILALGLFSPRLRPYAAWGIIALLVAFIPSHVYFVQIDGCIPDGLCTPLWVAWLRLLLIHPLLMLWAWWGR
jgi:uncharacterized membrane protein